MATMIWDPIQGREVPVFPPFNGLVAPPMASANLAGGQYPLPVAGFWPPPSPTIFFTLPTAPVPRPQPKPRARRQPNQRPDESTKQYKARRAAEKAANAATVQTRKAFTSPIEASAWRSPGDGRFFESQTRAFSGELRAFAPLERGLKSIDEASAEWLRLNINLAHCKWCKDHHSEREPQYEALPRKRPADRWGKSKSSTELMRANAAVNHDLARLREWFVGVFLRVDASADRRARDWRSERVPAEGAMLAASEGRMIRLNGDCCYLAAEKKWFDEEVWPGAVYWWCLDDRGQEGWVLADDIQVADVVDVETPVDVVQAQDELSPEAYIQDALTPRVLPQDDVLALQSAEDIQRELRAITDAADAMIGQLEEVGKGFDAFDTDMWEFLETDLDPEASSDWSTS